MGLVGDQHDPSPSLLLLGREQPLGLRNQLGVQHTWELLGDSRFNELNFCSRIRRFAE